MGQCRVEDGEMAQCVELWMEKWLSGQSSGWEMVQCVELWMGKWLRI